MKNLKNILWGLVLIGVGLLFALNALEITDIDIFFEGWWTLFLIVPCTIGLFSGQSRIFNITGLFVGVVALLACQDLIDITVIWKLLLPALLIIIGISLVFKDNINKTLKDKIRSLNQKKTNSTKLNAVFSGQKAAYTGEVFTGADLNALFGGITYDLRDAVINEDVVINARAVFGGVDIFVPEAIRVEVKSTSIFGGATNKKSAIGYEGAPTIYVDALCLFGGVTIK